MAVRGTLTGPRPAPGQSPEALGPHPLPRPHRLNEAALADYRVNSPDEFLDFLRNHLEPQGSTACFGGRVGLVDCLDLQQDIRRPLRMPRIVPAERLACALPFAVWAPPLRGFWKARGVRLVATDLAGPGARIRQDRLDRQAG